MSRTGNLCGSLKGFSITIATLLVVLGHAASPANAGINQWTSNGPEGGVVITIAINPHTPTTLYAGTNNLFKSTNGGNTWSPINTGPTDTNVRALAIDPSTPATIYAGTYGVVFKSINGGNTWSTINTGLTNTNVMALAIDPSTPSTIYAGTNGGGVFKSTNGGSTWSQATSGLTSLTVSSIAIDPSTPATIYAGTYGGVFKSTTGGDTWSRITTSTYVMALTIDPSTPATIYAGTWGGGVWKSTNAGSTWSTINTGLTNTTVMALAIDPFTPSTIYAGTSGGVFKSTNSGSTWSPIGAGLTNASVQALTIDPSTPATIYTGTYGGGVFKSTDSGNTWSPKNTGLLASLVVSLAFDSTHSSNLYSGTYSGVFRSTTGGSIWSPINTGLTNTYVQVLAIDPSTPATIFAGTNGGGVFKSTDGVNTWSPINTGLMNSNVQALAIDPSTPANIYAGTNGGGVFKSTNSGDTWTQANSGLTSFIVNSLAVDPSTPATIYAATNGGVFKSTNGGNTWSQINTSKFVYALAIYPSNSATLYAGGSGGVFKSTNGGNTWSQINTSLAYAFAFDPFTPATIYMGTSGGLFRSTNAGSTWNPIYAGLTNTNVHALAVDPVTQGTLYTGTYGGGVIAWTFSTTPPSPPSDVWVTPSDGQIRIGWNSAPDASSYNLYYSTSPTVTKGTGTKRTGITNPYTVSSLTNGTTYYFIVTAVNAYGESIESDQVSAIPTVSSLAYSLSDLAGNWEINSLTSGYSAPWWTRLSLTIASDGSYTLTQTHSDGTTSTGSGTMSITSSGIVTRADNPTFQCTMAPGKTVMACTATYGEKAYVDTELAIATKMGTSYSLADLTSTWNMNGLGTPGPLWSRGTFNFSEDGSISGTSNGSDGSSTPISGNIAISADGIITVSSAQLPLSFRCTMDSGKSVIACTDTTSGGETDMHIFTRKASSYSQADATGVWNVNTLISPTAWWGRGPINIQDNGSFSSNLNSSSGSPEPVSGTFTIGTDGTINAASDGMTSFGCDMEAGKTVTVCTGTGSSSDSNLMVLTKQAQNSTKTLSGFAVTNGPISVNESSTATYGATAYWSDGTSSSVPPTWSVTPTTYATIDSGTGVLATLSVTGDQAATINASYTFGGITLSATRKIIILDQRYTLTIGIDGNGNGSVNSIPSGPIACSYSPLAGTCSTNQTADTTLTLAATPGGDSTFSGWGGACTNSVGNCDVLFDADKSLTATFTLAPLARILTTPYATLLAAYNAAATSDTVIMLKEGEPGSALGTLNANADKSVTLRGGYNAAYTANSGSTVILGPVTLGSGMVIFDNVGVR
jgi:photosystem II stability/assembly factor-like uncharacterized protein